MRAVIGNTTARKEAIVMPNDNGDLPDYLPKMDKNEFVQFGDPAPVLAPALAKKLGMNK
ncbi:MAG: hypothetical protein J5855_01525 [Mailhella sp.]|nr:hypothetical protein [Mailhella sp.]